jgi:hypothetical protein
MTISVLIDSNAWNFLFDEGVDLAAALPEAEFSLFITSEVAIELQAIPEKSKTNSCNATLKRYIFESIGRARVKTSADFGFSEARLHSGRHVYAGFGQGTFQSEIDRNFYSTDEVKKYILGKSSRPSGLTKNEADASVAAQAFGSVVLTNDKKSGPIAFAKMRGGSVLSLSGFDPKLLSIRDYVMSSL